MSDVGDRPIPKPRISKKVPLVTSMSAENELISEQKPVPSSRSCGSEDEATNKPSSEVVVLGQTAGCSLETVAANQEIPRSLPPPLPPRKTSILSADSVPRSPIDKDRKNDSKNAQSFSRAMENPLYMSTSGCEDTSDCVPLSLSEEDVQFLASDSLARNAEKNSNHTSKQLEHSLDSSDFSWDLVGSRPSLVSTISLDTCPASRESFKDNVEVQERTGILSSPPVPVAQNVCYSGWLSMKDTSSRKEIKEKDSVRWFCVLKDRTLCFYYNELDCVPEDFCYDCDSIYYIGKQINDESEGSTSAFLLAIRGLQKVHHWRIEVDREQCNTWLLLIIKSCPIFGSALDMFQNEENYFEYDIRKIICIKSQVSDRSQWCHLIQTTSKLGPCLIASEGSSLYVQSEYDVITQCWKEAFEHELYAVSNELENQRLTARDVPHLVEKCINFISTYGIHEEGIYRHNGTIKKSRELLASFQKDPTDVEIRSDEYTVHDVASTLKYFFRYLDESIFTRHLKPEFLKLCCLPEADMYRKLAGYEELLLTMESEHKVNYATLRKLFGHLKEVTDNCGINKMPVSNIAAIFGASLFCDEADPSRNTAAYGNTALKISVVSDLISYYYQVFRVSVKEVDDKVICSKVAGSEIKKTQAGSLLIPVHMFEFDNQAFNVQDYRTAEEVCRFAVEHHNLKEEDGPYALFEVVRNGSLDRVVFPDERLISIAINRWQNWTDMDKSGNYLLFKKDYVRPRLESVTPYPFVTEVLFADIGSKSFKKATFQCVKGEVCYFKNSKVFHYARN